MALKGEIEHFKHVNAKLVEDQYEFKGETDALKRHVSLLNQQNFEVIFDFYSNNTRYSFRLSLRNSLRQMRQSEEHLTERGKLKRLDTR
jgi:hypothetical protein